MTAKMLLGKPLASKIYEDVTLAAKALKANGKSVHIRGVLVGDDPASIAYLRIKEQRCRECHIYFSLVSYPADIAEDELVQSIKHMNSDDDITGIIIQLPLPSTVDRDLVLKTVMPRKDIDAFFYTLRVPTDLPETILPPTPAGMMRILDQYNILLENKQIVVVGNGLLVGNPLLQLLKQRGFHPVLVDTHTPKYVEIIQSADVLFTGVGQANVITPEMIKPGVVIVDAGYDKVGDKVYGDVSADCMAKAAYMTPAIGGIGPLTVACLLSNAVELAKLQQ